jgi:hypothetical protein
LLYLLLHLLLLVHRGCSHYGLVLFQVVIKFPLFILSVIVDHVNSFAFRGAGNSRDPTGASGGESGDGGRRLPGRGQDLLDHIGRTLGRWGSPWACLPGLSVGLPKWHDALLTGYLLVTGILRSARWRLAWSGPRG